MAIGGGFGPRRHLSVRQAVPAADDRLRGDGRRQRERTRVAGGCGAADVVPGLRCCGEARRNEVFAATARRRASPAARPDGVSWGATRSTLFGGGNLSPMLPGVVVEACELRLECVESAGGGRRQARQPSQQALLGKGFGRVRLAEHVFGAASGRHDHRIAVEGVSGDRRGPDVRGRRKTRVAPVDASFDAHQFFTIAGDEIEHLPIVQDIHGVAPIQARREEPKAGAIVRHLGVLWTVSRPTIPEAPRRRRQAFEKKLIIFSKLPANR